MKYRPDKRSLDRRGFKDKCKVKLDWKTAVKDAGAKVTSLVTDYL